MRDEVHAKVAVFSAMALFFPHHLHDILSMSAIQQHEDKSKIQNPLFLRTNKPTGRWWRLAVLLRIEQQFHSAQPTVISKRKHLAAWMI